MIGVGVVAGACLACMALLICMFWTSIFALVGIVAIMAIDLIKSILYRNRSNAPPDTV